MIKKVITLIISTFFCAAAQLSIAQELDKTDSLYRQAAVNVLEKYLTEETSNRNTIIYSIGTDIHLVIIENRKNYTYYIIDSGFHDINDIMVKKTIKKPNALLSEAFDPSKYIEGFTNLQADLFEDGYKGTLTFDNDAYLALIDSEGNAYSEFRLPVIINPAPIPKDVYLFLFTTLMSEGVNQGAEH